MKTTTVRSHTRRTGAHVRTHARRVPASTAVVEYGKWIRNGRFHGALTHVTFEGGERVTLMGRVPKRAAIEQARAMCRSEGHPTVSARGAPESHAHEDEHRAVYFLNVEGAIMRAGHKSATEANAIVRDNRKRILHGFDRVKRQGVGERHASAERLAHAILRRPLTVRARPFEFGSTPHVAATRRTTGALKALRADQTIEIGGTRYHVQGASTDLITLIGPRGAEYTAVRNIHSGRLYVSGRGGRPEPHLERAIQRMDEGGT